MRHSFVLAPLGLLLVAACSQDAGPAAAPSASAPVKEAEKAKGPNALVRAESFAYTAQGRRDPFRSYLVEISEQRSSEHQTRKREQTELFELTDYHLTGLMTGISQPKAMVEDPQGRGHVVQIGTRLGKNGGRVTTIAPHGIQVVEDTVDPLGRHVRNAIDVPLPQTPIDAESSP